MKRDICICQAPGEKKHARVKKVCLVYITYYCICHGPAVTFCFLLAGGKTPDVNDRTFAKLMMSSALDREKVSNLVID